MPPRARKLMDVAIKHLRGCPVTCSNIRVTEDIYGENIGSLKGKQVFRPNIHVASGVDPVPEAILEWYREITLCINIMFVNNVPLLVTTS